MSQDALLRNLIERLTLEQFVAWLIRHIGTNYVRALAMRLAEFTSDDQPTRLYAIQRRGSTTTGQAAHEAANRPASIRR